MTARQDDVDDRPGPVVAPQVAHRLRRMTGRDPHEPHRTATPLELLYDLTFVVAFGVAGSQLAHLLAEGHVAAGLAGFGFAMFAICWAWINFSWFASAYDTDDWAFRLATMVQMVGVIVLALGLPAMFGSIDANEPVDNGVMVAGYVVMRVAMISLWLRAARQDPGRRRACLAYVTAISTAQVGWFAMIVLPVTSLQFLLGVVVLVLVEVGGPVVAERRDGGTPWHPHHIAERYGLLAIITLGEGVIGTVASLNAVIEAQGWTTDAVLVAVAGTGLTFGIWWIYFLTPAGEALHAHRERSFAWGYGHILVFASIAGVGAGLHVAAYYLEHESHLGATATVLAVVVPVAAFVLVSFGLEALLLRTSDPFHALLVVLSSAALVLPVVLAARGVPMAVCLVVLTLAPLVKIVGYETVGHRHQAAAVARLAARE